MMTLERRRDLITVLKPYFLRKRLHSTRSYFIKAIDHTFYGFTGVITHLGLLHVEIVLKTKQPEAETSLVYDVFIRVIRKERELNERREKKKRKINM